MLITNKHVQCLFCFNLSHTGENGITYYDPQPDILQCFLLNEICIGDCLVRNVKVKS